MTYDTRHFPKKRDSHHIQNKLSTFPPHQKQEACRSVPIHQVTQGCSVKMTKIRKSDHAGLVWFATVDDIHSAPRVETMVEAILGIGAGKSNHST